MGLTMGLTMDNEDRNYMNYLDEVYGVDGYGLLMIKGDPIAFEVGKNEWLKENKAY